MLTDKVEYVECSCASMGHTLRFDYDPAWPCMYVSQHMGHLRGFWRRVWKAVKYILCEECPYGHFQETVLERPQIEQLRDLCDKVLAVMPTVGQGAA